MTDSRVLYIKLMEMSEKYNIEELIIRYLQQDINEEELHYLESWLEEDAEHRVSFFELKNISDSSRMSFLQREDICEGSWQRMKTRLKSDWNGSAKAFNFPTSLQIPFLNYMKYIAVAIIAIGIGWGMNRLQWEKNQSDSIDNRMTYNEIHVQKGGRANTLILSDGSKVILNAATSFKYPSSFNKKERQVYLDGEAYFEVAKDTARPFIVKLHKQDVTVLGTTFNVQAYDNEPYSIITLLSGRIKLEAFDEFGESTGYKYLSPHQQAISENKTGSVSLVKVDTSFVNSWINGEYKFKDEPLASIAKRLEKYYDVRIHIDNERLQNVRYTGTFLLDQDILEVFRIIDYEKQFTFKKVRKDIFVTSR